MFELPGRFSRLSVALVILAFAGTNYSHVGLAQQASKIRWDIVKRTSFSPPDYNTGGVVFASAHDGSFIKLTGSGTFGPGEADPVTGGGTWETFDVGGRSTGKGKYTIAGLVSFQEVAGEFTVPAINNIGRNEDRRGGLAVLRVAYSDKGGSPAGNGILIVSCRVRGTAGVALFEGAIASKGAVMYFNRMPEAPGVDANRTIFHRQAS